jgi:DNA repair photolyase
MFRLSFACVARRTRGTDSNPDGRFEPTRREAFEPDPDPDAEPEPDPRTRLSTDLSRSIVARNESPDVGFEASVNPYRGCEHGCVYCLTPDTPVVRADLTWHALGDVKVGDELIGFDEFPLPGRITRKLRRSVVENVCWSRKPVTRIVTPKAEVETSVEHLWLQDRNLRWSRTDQLETGESLSFLLPPCRAPIDGVDPATEPARIEAIEKGPVRDVVDIQTSTRTFYAAGLATHNCYARPTHEYLGMSAGLDFETRILVKRDAPELLRRALASPRWKPTVLALSGVTDPYQPAERRLLLTRRCLGVLAEFRNPVAVVTKSYTVTRDVDLLAELAASSAASVSISLTTLDPELQRRMEPRASAPRRRLAAIERLAGAGVPVGVLIAPIVPGLTDHEIPALLAAAADSGAGFAGRVVLRLPHGVKQLFEDWLARHYPERREKVLARLRSLHGGRLYDPGFGRRQRGQGPFAEQIGALFDVARRRAGLAEHGPELSTAGFHRPGGRGSQLALF